MDWKLTLKLEKQITAEASHIYSVAMFQRKQNLRVTNVIRRFCFFDLYLYRLGAVKSYAQISLQRCRQELCAN